MYIAALTYCRVDGTTVDHGIPEGPWILLIIVHNDSGSQ